MKANLARNGLTLTDAMIIVILIGIVAAVAIPGWFSLQNHMKEAELRRNMHIVQLGFEDFGTLTNGIYPAEATSMTYGKTLQDLMEGGTFPKNPFTGLETKIVWSGNDTPIPNEPGTIFLEIHTAINYLIRGVGANGELMPLVLSNL